MSQITKSYKKNIFLALCVIIVGAVMLWIINICTSPEKQIVIESHLKFDQNQKPQIEMELYNKGIITYYFFTNECGVLSGDDKNSSVTITYSTIPDFTKFMPLTFILPERKKIGHGKKIGFVIPCYTDDFFKINFGILKTMHLKFLILKRNISDEEIHKIGFTKYPQLLKEIGVWVEAEVKL